MTTRAILSEIVLSPQEPVLKTSRGDVYIAGEKGRKAEGGPAKIAQVFEKRLDMGMKLDCDPTTIYAALLEDRYRGVIHKSDLESTSPYNTYQHRGLPPGPIANPGMASIEAVLSPAETA